MGKVATTAKWTASAAGAAVILALQTPPDVAASNAALWVAKITGYFPHWPHYIDAWLTVLGALLALTPAFVWLWKARSKKLKSELAIQIAPGPFKFELDQGAVNVCHWTTWFRSKRRHYVRLKIKNQSGVLAEKVAATLVRVRRRLDGGSLEEVEYGEQIPLGWALRSPPQYEMDLSDGQEEKVGVFRAYDGRLIEPAFDRPGLVTFTGTPGTYVAEVQVVSANQPTQRPTFWVRWNGKGPFEYGWDLENGK